MSEDELITTIRKIVREEVTEGYRQDRENTIKETLSRFGLDLTSDDDEISQSKTDKLIGRGTGERAAGRVNTLSLHVRGSLWQGDVQQGGRDENKKLTKIQINKDMKIQEFTPESAPTEGDIYRIKGSLMRCKKSRTSGINTFQIIDEAGEDLILRDEHNPGVIEDYGIRVVRCKTV